MNNWYRKSKPTRSIVPLSHFVSARVFALKNGGYGCLLGLAGVDDEGLTQEHVSSITARIKAALASLPEGGRLYQYVRVRKGFVIPRKDAYANPTAEEFVARRIEYLNENARFRRIDLFWCLTLEPTGPKRIRRSPDRQARETARSISSLEKAVEIITSQLGELLGLRVLDQDAVVSFFTYLINLEDWSASRRMISDRGLDRQIATSSVEWHRDHLRIGKRHVQMFTLLDSPAGSKPNLFGGLQVTDADMILCSIWEQKPREAVKKRISEIESFIGLFKHRLLGVAAHMGSLEKLENSMGAKAADKSTDRLGEILADLDSGGPGYGRYSLALMLHSRSEAEVVDAIPQLHRAFTDAAAPYIEETAGNLAAFYAMFPGNSSGDSATDFNVRRFWLRADHNADLALVYAPYVGSPRSEDLADEYLSVYETRTGAPFFLDPYDHGMRTTLLLGAPRSGKSVNGNQIIAHEQKYGGFTYVIDIGGSYESTIRAYGGVIERVGVGNPRINPFSIEPTEDNLQFLFGFIRLLLQSGGAQLTPEDEEGIAVAIRRMYEIPATVRRLGNLLLPRHLQGFLAKWSGGGVYARTFDNVEDSLRLARIQCFDFEAITESQHDLIEPLLFWILRQITTVMRDRANLGVPKHILFDELWKQLRSRQLLQMALDSLKTGGKHLVGATLLTQSASDLGEHADLIVNACSTQLFLPDPTFNREAYQRLFNLNDQEVDNIASLRPREAMLKRTDFSKVIKLNLDQKSYWMFTTRPKDRVARQKAIDEFGVRAFEHLTALEE